MSLNTTQRKILRDVFRESVDGIMEDRGIEYKQKCELLNFILSNDHPSIQETITILKHNIVLVDHILEATNQIPAEIRGHWRAIKLILETDHPTLSPELLNELKKVPNYNPILVASMKKFEDKIKNVSNISEAAKLTLIRLRELYLEMSPMQSYNYGEGYRTFHFRIGNFPLNIQKYSDEPPIPGEIQSDVQSFIEERIEQENVHQKDIEEKVSVERQAQQVAYSIVSADIQNLDTVSTLANGGDSDAQYNLGNMYEKGKQGLRANLVTAVHWYQQSANQGNLRGQHALGRMYEKGLGGLEKDINKALQLYQNVTTENKKRVEEKNISAQLSLGLDFYHGRKGVKNRRTAFDWFAKAAEKGNADAQYNMGSIFDDGKEGIVKDDAKAIECYTKAAEKGHGGAQLTLGLMYFEGKGRITKDYVKAFELLKKAATSGNATAQFMVASMYRDGKGVARSYISAFKWCSKAASQGLSVAQAMLGNFYHAGYGVKRNSDTAYEWWMKAAAQGNEQAKFSLSYKAELGHMFLATPLYLLGDLVDLAVSSWNRSSPSAR